MTLQGQVQAVFAAKAVTSKGSRTALPTLQRAQHSFSWAACAYGSKLGDSCDTPGASIQAALSAKAVTSKGSRTALPTLQRAPHSFSWAACDFGSKLGDTLMVFNGYPLPTANDSWVAASLMARACYVLSRKNLGINTVHEVQINHCYPIG